MYNLTIEASYPTPFANSPLLPFLLLSMVGQRHAPRTTEQLRDSYDYIIVGGGSAGSVIASRLSEIPCINVLLLEAGKPAPKLTDVPGIARSFIQTDIDWNYHTAPQKHTGAGLIDRAVAWPSGKTLGGSSVINAMLNLRGNHKNYDDWAASGAEGWSYEHVLPYFKKLENNVNPEYVQNGYHGVGGPVTVSKPRYDGEIKEPVFQEARNQGYSIGDVNGPRQRGFYDLQATIRDGQRCSAAKAYLVPSDHRKNLHIVSEAFVRKIIIDNHQVKGVEIDYKGETKRIPVFKEVIMTAGSINTAKLLMLSGIGPREELDKHNIRVISDLPVGRNLQDHFATLMSFELQKNIPSFSEKLENQSYINQYIHTKKGPLTSVQGVSTVAFLDKNGIDAPGDHADFQLYFWEAATEPARTQIRMKPEYFEQIFGPYVNKTIFWCLSQVLHPKGRGTVTLKSSDPYDPPVIDPNYFSSPEDMDVVVEGMKKCKEFGTSEPLKNIGAKRFTTVYPGCEAFVSNDDEYFRCMARSIIITLSHPVGTAKMGNVKDPSTVVDSKLRVKTVQGLRVADASVMPLVPGGNTNVPTMMVAEKASDLIKEDITCIQNRSGGFEF